MQYDYVGLVIQALPYALAVAGVVYGYVRLHLPLTKQAKLDQYTAFLRQFVGDVVVAVEQTSNGLAGADKKQKAEYLADSGLKALGLDPSDPNMQKLVDTFIEASVFALPKAAPSGSAPLQPTTLLPRVSAGGN